MRQEFEPFSDYNSSINSMENHAFPGANGTILYNVHQSIRTTISPYERLPRDVDLATFIMGDRSWMGAVSNKLYDEYRPLEMREYAKAVGVARQIQKLCRYVNRPLFQDQDDSTHVKWRDCIPDSIIEKCLCFLDEEMITTITNSTLVSNVCCFQQNTLEYIF
jgi:hypothetical protein